MSFTAPKFTDEGKALQAKAQAGTALKFTKMQLGDGELGSQAIAAMTKLINPIITLDISSIKAGNNYAAIKSNFSNSGISTGFYWREIGVFAADPEKPNDRNSDILYCYANAGSLAEYIPAAGSEIIEKVISVPCIIGDAENVSASVKSEIYITKADLDEHVNNKNNPHEVTAEQIGALTDTTLTKTAILNKIGILDIAHGGTGASTASTALENLGGLAKSSYTANDILTKLKIVDGSGSGLDADLFKGNSTIPIANGGTGATYAQEAFNNLGQRAFMGASTDVNSPNQAGCYNSNGWRQVGGANDIPTNNYGIFENKQVGGYIKQIYACTNKYGDYGLYIRLGEQSNIAENEWQRVYTSRNAASLIQNLLKGGSISVVKSVQRGTATFTSTGNMTITISSVTAAKCSVNLKSGLTGIGTTAYKTGTSSDSGGSYSTCYGSRVVSLSATQLVISANYASISYGTSGKTTVYGSVEWEVVEYY